MPRRAAYRPGARPGRGRGGAGGGDSGGIVTDSVRLMTSPAYREGRRRGCWDKVEAGMQAGEACGDRKAWARHECRARGCAINVQICLLSIS